MQSSMQGFNWTYMQAHLPLIAFALVGVPLTMLFFRDLLKLSAKQTSKQSPRDVRMLSHKCDENGLPVIVDMFGRPIEAEIAVSASDMHSRRATAMRSTKSRCKL